jgi:hypothetical protein
MSAARLLLVVGLALTACTRADATAPPLPQTTISDPRYRGLVFLVATIRRAGTDFTITNDSTQPWFDVTIALGETGADEYLARVDEVDAGQTVMVASTTFTTSRGLAFDARRVMPHTLIVSAEIGEGGPTGAYAVRL